MTFANLLQLVEHARSSATAASLLVNKENLFKNLHV